MSNVVIAQASKLAKSLGMEGEGQDLIATLKATAFKGQVTDAQMAALLLVANQYGLSPWTKEIYAFPDKNNGIVPVVGVDGWSRIINNHPQFDGMEFRQSESMVTPKGGKPAPEWMECVIYRKDRANPIVVREYLDEVYREPFTKKGDRGEYTVDGPWQSHTKRFMRHKVLIQCARLAFGYGGIYDQDEAEQIVERDVTSEGSHTVTDSAPKQLPPYPDADFEKNLPAWREAIAAGKARPEQIVSRSATRYTLSAEQMESIYDLAKPAHVDNDGVIDADFVREFEGVQQ